MTIIHIMCVFMYRGQIISPSGNSNLCGTVAGMVMPKGSMSTKGERLQVSVLPYRCSICPPLVTRQCQFCNQVPATHIRSTCVAGTWLQDWHRAPVRLGRHLECLSLCWHALLRRDHPGYCTAEVGNPGGTYELPRVIFQLGDGFVHRLFLSLTATESYFLWVMCEHKAIYFKN